MSELNQSVKTKPIYDSEGLFRGWQVIYLEETSGLFSPVPRSRFFVEVLPGDSYIAMCKFRESLLKQNENNK